MVHPRWTEGDVPSRHMAQFGARSEHQNREAHHTITGSSRTAKRRRLELAVLRTERIVVAVKGLRIAAAGCLL